MYSQTVYIHVVHYTCTSLSILALSVLGAVSVLQKNEYQDNAMETLLQYTYIHLHVHVVYMICSVQCTLYVRLTFLPCSLGPSDLHCHNECR